MTPTVVLSARGEQRLRMGHPWIYRADVVQADAAPGDRVAVRGRRGRVLGHAFYSDRSQIVLRLFSYGPEPADDALVRRRLEAAIGFRTRLGIEGTAYRLVHAEGDLLPSLIVDRYGDTLVAQFTSAGTERWKGVIADALLRETGLTKLYERSDASVRSLEGLEPATGWLRGGPWQGYKCIGCSLAMGPGGAILAEGPYGEAAESLIVVEVEPVERTITGAAIAKMLAGKGYKEP